MLHLDYVKELKMFLIKIVNKVEEKYIIYNFLMVEVLVC